MTSAFRPVACAMCGTVARPDNGDGDAASGGAPPLGWMSEVDPRRGTVWVCPSCARTAARSIEARLDREWW